MNKNWLYLVILGLVITALLIGWDVIATFTGFKQEFSFSINPIEDRLYGPVEDHFRKDPEFTQFEVQAAEQVTPTGNAP
jgi:hypothetical protein